MRIWDLPVSVLCKKHLSGEHRELHGLWNILTQGKTGYRNHPETKRWVGKLRALYIRHQEQVAEMDRRGWNHKSELDESLATGSSAQDAFLNTPQEQVQLLLDKNCECSHYLCETHLTAGKAAINQKDAHEKPNLSFRFDPDLGGLRP